MKKLAFITSAVLFSAGTIFMIGCKKDDTSTPTITVTGKNPLTISLNATAPSDPGATAQDDQDGDLSASVKSDWSTTNPNVNKAGTYTIKYTVSDAAGNQGSATRTVYVVNDAEAWAGTYAKAKIIDSVFADAAHKTFVQVYVWKNDLVVTSSTTVNNKIMLSPFSDYSNIASTETVYGTVAGTTLTIPSQTAHACGTPATDHTFQGGGMTTSTSPFKFTIASSDNTSGGIAYDAVHFSK